MATSILALPPAATGSIPTLQTLDNEIRTLNIGQQEILEVMNLRNEVAQLQADLEEKELSIKARLDMGFAVEPGPRTASLKVTERRNVSWKAIVERELGTGYASNVLAHTKPCLTFSLVLA